MQCLEGKRNMTKPPLTIKAAALFYAKCGFYVFPAPPGKKKSYKKAEFSDGRKWGMSNDAEAVKKDWEKWPEANIGLPTGSVSGFFVLDIDNAAGHDVDGDASLRGLEEEHGRLPETCTARTHSGGTHYYFRNPPGIKIKNSSGEIAPGIDVRGEGGMVIAPPSIKPGSGVYAWTNWREMEAAPDWLIELCKEKLKLRSFESSGPSKTDVSKVVAAVKVIKNDHAGWEEWNNVGLAIYAATNGGDEGFEAFREYSEKSAKSKPSDVVERWTTYRTCPPTRTGADKLFKLADLADPTWRAVETGVNLVDFVSYMPLHNYIFIPTRGMWPASSVNSQIAPVPMASEKGRPLLGDDGKPKYQAANKWLDKHQHVEQMTWAPGEQLQIHDRLVAEGGWFNRLGVTCFNLYRPPTIALGNENDVTIWTDHIRKVYPDDADHIIKWCAHRVQRPQEKINHALFMGGEQGVGKDTILEPVKRAIGPWNFIEISPKDMSGQFNGYLKCVILRVNEAHDLGEISRYQFYERMKTFSASPPDVHRVNEKHVQEHYVMNCNGVVITSNHKTDGIYLPPDDRRTYVAWSKLTKEDFDEEYWIEIWDWYDSGGDNNIAAYLATLDISDFNAKSPPPKTEAFYEIVNSNTAPEENDLSDLIDAMKAPDALTVPQLKIYCEDGGITKEQFNNIYDWLTDVKSARAIPHKLLGCGYCHFRNPIEKRGRWTIEGKQTAVYVKSSLTYKEQATAVSAMVAGNVVLFKKG